jgi:phosphinothricin acetyltransferase
MKIRFVERADLQAINAIYNHYVLNSTCTYDEDPTTEAERDAWFELHRGNYPATVAVINDEVVGWASLSSYRKRYAYRFTVENSVYVREDCQRRGIGGKLLADLIVRARELEMHSIVAGIDSEQEGSIVMHEKHGFVTVAHLPQVGYKFRRWLDVVFMQKML